MQLVREFVVVGVRPKRSVAPPSTSGWLWPLGMCFAQLAGCL
jgi:hypothetical protein